MVVRSEIETQESTFGLPASREVVLSFGEVNLVANLA